MSAPNKYHKALNLAMNLIEVDMRHLPKTELNAEAIKFRQEAGILLAELQNVLLKIAQLKQSLKELDLEESK